MAEPEPPAEEVDGIDFMWWTNEQLVRFATAKWDVLNEDIQDSLAAEIYRRISETNKNPEGSSTTH